MAAAAPPYEILALPMGEHRCRALRAALDAHRWRPKYRDGVAKDLCYSDTIFQGPILDEVKKLLPQEMFRYNTIQANRYDPEWWTHSEIHQDAGNYQDSRMMVLGDFQGGDFLIFPNGRDQAPLRIRERYQWIKFDGHLFHGSEPITRGIRYSVIAFRFGDRET